MSDQEIIDQDIDGVNVQKNDQIEEKDSTNWKAWYIGLVVFLVAQIIVYLWITKSYEA